MVMFCLMTKRRINLARLILDFILVTVHTERRRHATLPYDMFLTRIFIWAQLPIDGHKVDTKRPTMTMKTFSALALKSQAPQKEKEKEKEKKDKKKKDSSKQKISAQKHKSKPSEEGKKKKRSERSLSPISEERRTSKRRLLKLAKDLSFEYETYAIIVALVNVAPTTRHVTRTFRLAQRGIVIKEPMPHDQ